MQAISHPRMTPWVTRLIIANAVVLLLLETVFTSDGVFRALAFDPATALSRPWTFFTYMFVHADLLHLLANSLGLWMLGSAVEQRLGGEKFLLYYLYCGVGAAFFALLLSRFALVQPFVGASGAILGLAFRSRPPEARPRCDSPRNRPIWTWCWWTSTLMRPA